MTDELPDMTKGPRRRNPEESRRRILDAGEKAFAMRGFGGARLRDIAQEAGVHHALVHHYFGDKRGLFQEVIKRGMERMAIAGSKALAAPIDLESTVRAFVGVLFDFCRDNRSLQRILEDALRNREWESWEIAQEALGGLAGPLVKLLKQRIEAGQRLGFVRRDLPADSMIALGFGAVVYRFDSTEHVLTALGLQRNEQDLLSEREHAVKYVLGAIRSQDA